MDTSHMRAPIVRIGNSRGLRLPKPLLDSCGIGDSVDLTIEGDRIILRAARRVREGWAQAATDMHQRDEDRLLDPTIPTAFDETDWEW